MSQTRQFNIGGGNYHQTMNDTTYTKLFVGGLAWETQRDTMKKYFEQFGEILEAVVITDKTTGRSKGYGFVTFKEPDAAFRACQNSSPVIDGRRANCNLASFGVQKNQQQQQQPTPPQHVGGGGGGGGGGGRLRGSAGLLSAPPQAPAYHGSSSYFHQPPFPYSPYGYTPGYPHDTMYQMNYYGGYGQQFSAYYPTSGVTAAASGGYYHNFYPYYTTSPGPSPGPGPGPGPFAQNNQGHVGFGYHQYPHPQMVQQYPFLPQQQFTSSGILSLPTSTMSIPTTPTTGVTTTTTTVGALAGTLSGPSQQVSTEQNSTLTS